ncbi:MAG: hypothetical protein ACYS5V_00535 [Planctomycetota bacterium]|jgi:hypothetical protein
MSRRKKRAERAPPYAALALVRDQVSWGVRRRRRADELPRDRFETTADWERRAAGPGPPAEAVKFARIARAYLTGKSPRTVRGRWRRDLAYLRMVAAEAERTLTAGYQIKYEEMVEDWRAVEPVGFFGRYMALRDRRRGRPRDPVA